MPGSNGSETESEPWSTAFAYVVCPPYHGATFLGLLLNNHSKISHLGDTLPDPVYLTDRPARCSCGLDIKVCPFWTHLTSTVGAKHGGPGLVPEYPRISAWPPLNKLLNVAVATAARRLGRGVWRPFEAAASDYLDAYRAFRSEVKAWQGTELFVDGGKSLVRVWVNASLLPRSPIRLIHLTRDPRAFHGSNVKNWGRGWTPARSARRWKAKHRKILSVARRLDEGSYLHLRYEDLCRQPEQALGRVLDFLDMPRENLLRPQPNPDKDHVIGSTSKERFDGTVRFSESWRERIATEEAADVLRRAEPYASRLGYA